MSCMVRMIGLSLKLYRADLRRHLMAAVSISTGLYLFLTVAIYFDCQYMSAEAAALKLQDNYVVVSTYDGECMKSLREEFAKYSYAVEIGSFSSYMQGIRIDNRVLACEYMWNGAYICSGLDRDENIGSNYEKYELICGRSEFIFDFEVIISEGYAELIADNPQEALGRKLFMSGDNGMLPYTVVGVYAATETETSVNARAVRELYSGKESSLKFTVFLSEDIASAEEYMLYIGISEDEDEILEKLELLKKPGMEFDVETGKSKKAYLSMVYASYTFTKCLILIFISLLSGMIIFGTVTNSVSLRKKEIGIRVAVGAKKTDIMLGFIMENFIGSAISIFIATAFTAVTAFIYVFIQKRLLYSFFVFSISFSTIYLFLIYTFMVMFGFSLIPAYRAGCADVLENLRE